MRLLNTQNFKSVNIKIKILYAVLAYNNSIHSVTKFKPIDLINGHIAIDDPFNINTEQVLLNDYVENHRKYITHLHANINSKLIDYYEKINAKLNKNRKNLEITPNQKIFEKNCKSI